MKNLAIVFLASVTVLASTPALAKRVTVVKPTSTTVVEHHANGSVDTITTTPTGFTIQNGMPFVPTSVVVTPTYHAAVTSPVVATTTVTPAATATDTIVNTVDANGVPMTTVVKPTAVVSTTTTTPILTTPVVTTPVITTPVVATPTVVVAP